MQAKTSTPKGCQVIGNRFLFQVSGALFENFFFHPSPWLNEKEG
jgi:hypothetical protein